MFKEEDELSCLTLAQCKIRIILSYESCKAPLVESHNENMEIEMSRIGLRHEHPLQCNTASVFAPTNRDLREVRCFRICSERSDEPGYELN